MARPASDNTTAVWKFLRGKGFTPAQTAGIIGGLKGESGPGLNPSARNPSSGAIGIGQWLGGRARGVRPGDLRGQLQHLWSELQGPERGALQRVKGAHTIEGAVDAWVRGFERPSAGEIASSIGSRKSMARETFNRLSGVPGAASTGGGGGSSGGSGGSTRTTTTTTPGVDNSLARLALVQSFLGNKNSDVLDFAAQAKGLADVPETTSTQTERLPGSRASAKQSATTGSSSFSKAHSPLLELIHNTGNGPGYAVKDGHVVNGPSFYSGVWAGHKDHVHVAAGKRTIIQLGRLAQQMGLRVGENPHFGGVAPVHAPHSYHYKGEAIDVSGDPRKMNAYAKRVERLYGLK
jgi:hypothetical protein